MTAQWVDADALLEAEPAPRPRSTGLYRVDRPPRKVKIMPERARVKMVVNHSHKCPRCSLFTDDQIDALANGKSMEIPRDVMDRFTVVESRLIRRLANAMGCWVNLEALSLAVWGYAGGERLVRVNVSRMRKKLAGTGYWIETQPWVGYRLVEG